MRCLPHPKHLAAALTLGAALTTLNPHASAQSPAELAPADTAIYVHINEPAAWLGDLTQGPLGQAWKDKIETSRDMGDLLAALGMDLDTFMDVYFGGDVVVLSPGDDEDGVIFTQVAQADRVKRLGFEMAPQNSHDHGRDDGGELANDSLVQSDRFGQRFQHAG